MNIFLYKNPVSILCSSKNIFLKIFIIRFRTGSWIKLIVKQSEKKYVPPENFHRIYSVKFECYLFTVNVVFEVFNQIKQFFFFGTEVEF